MSKKVSLTARYRPLVGRKAVKQVRREKRVPAVIYGGRESWALDLDEVDIVTKLNASASAHLMVDLIVEKDGQKHKKLALIQEMQRHPLRDRLIHLDLHEIDESKPIRVEVSLIPVGEPAGVRNQGGVLDQPLHALEVECLPKDLPDRIEVDVSSLEIDQSIAVKDIKLPSGVEVLNNAELIALMVHAPKVVEEPASAATPAGEPEVINEKKEESAEAGAKSEKAEKGEKAEKSGA